MTAPTRHAQGLRLAAVLVFVGLPALFLTLSLLNLLQIGANRLTVEETTRQATALQRRLARVSSGRDEPTSLLSVRATSRTLAMAQLQQILTDAVAAASGRMIETAATDGTPGAEADGDRIAVKTVLDIDNDGLLDLLVHVEGGVPLMMVESLSIRRLPGSQVAAAEDDPARGEGPILLRVDLAVSARWAPSSQAGS